MKKSETDYDINMKYSPKFGYTVLINGEIVLECVSFDELRDVTIEQMIEFYKSVKEN